MGRAHHYADAPDATLQQAVRIWYETGNLSDGGGRWGFKLLGRGAFRADTVPKIFIHVKSNQKEEE